MLALSYSVKGLYWMRNDCLYQYPMITECVQQGRAADHLGIVYVSRESLQDKKKQQKEMIIIRPTFRPPTTVMRRRRGNPST